MATAKTAATVETRKAIAVHHTGTDTGAWDGPGQEANLSNGAGEATYKKAFAWQDPDKDANTKAAYKFIHHDVSSDGKVGEANVKGCQTGIGVLNGGRGGTTIPDSDRQGVYNHLAAHLRDSGIKDEDVPVLRHSHVAGEKRAGYQPAPYRADPDETVPCPGCGRMNDTDANFCDQCDHPLDATTNYVRQDDEVVQCPQCQRFNDPDAHYCDQCGIRLEGRPDVQIAAESNNNNDGMIEAGAPGVGKENGISANFTSRPEAGEIRRENLLRARAGGVEVRSDPATGMATQLAGIFTEYRRWYEIDSAWEGEFIESFAPGSLTDTLRDDRSSMRVLFDHGFDPSIGNKPIGPIRTLTDTQDGPYYEVDFLDTDYNREFVIPALTGQLMTGQRVGTQLGASMRFEVVEDQWNFRPQPSATNPKALPERTVLKAKVREFGPVTFPANPGATAVARSRTDEWIRHVRNDPRFAADWAERVGTKVANRVLRSLPEEIPDPQRDQRIAVLRRRAKALLVMSRV